MITQLIYSVIKIKKYVKFIDLFILKVSKKLCSSSGCSDFAIQCSFTCYDILNSWFSDAL